MVKEILHTDFADVKRAEKEDIKYMVNYLQNIPIIQLFIDLVPDIFLVLNKERQIVYLNHSLLKILGIEDANSVYGLRPGEALGCIHANDSEGGCGTTQFCRYCGAVNAMLKSQQDNDKTMVEECRITVGEDNTALDFRVWAKTITLDGTPYTTLVVRDISNEKRRSALERTFFHDILNTAGGIQGIMELLDDATGKELDELIHLVESASETLIEEIKAQKDLLAAETGDLKLDIRALNSNEILSSVHDIYVKHDVANGKNIAISPDCESVDFKSDARILKRIVSNMLKNALEATVVQATATVGTKVEDGQIKFWVHNDTVMTEEVKMQFFQRSFSTKGSGRGIGTYSLKMLGEKYLKGKVSFSSEKGEGTIVSITLPLSDKNLCVENT